MRKVLIFGANSAIAQGSARFFAENGDALFLVGRNPEKLQSVVQDIKVRGCQNVGSITADLNETRRHGELIETARRHMGGLDTVLIAHGELGKQEEAQKSYEASLEILGPNFLSQVSLLTLLANDFEKQRNGTIAVIGSVAGDRGRMSNYIYGASKGAIAIFLSGLRQRLFRSNVKVLTIKPGFVDTPMTAGFKKGPLFAQPDAVGRTIAKAVYRGKDILYVPWFWRCIMMIIRSIPEAIFKRTKI